MAGRIPPDVMPSVGAPVKNSQSMTPISFVYDKTENGKEDAYHTKTKQTEQSERDVLRKMFSTYHILLLSFARRYSFYREVYQQADKKQYDSQEEQCLVMRATRRRFAQFGGNCGGNRAQRFQNGMGNYAQRFPSPSAPPSFSPTARPMPRTNPRT